MHIDRRTLIRLAALTPFGGLTLAACGGGDEGFPLPDCETPGCATRCDDEGPFYRASDVSAIDLTQLGEASYENAVTRLRLSGRVLGGAGCDTPAAGATVELWHADPDGHYDVRESSPGAGDAVPDEAVQIIFRTQLTTDADGTFTLITYVPFGYYDRPQHIHVKVSGPGLQTLTTQLYFEGDPKLGNISAAERDRIDTERLLATGPSDVAELDVEASVVLRVAAA